MTGDKGAVDPTAQLEEWRSAFRLAVTFIFF